jgi:carbonic anhydrase
MLHSCQNLLDGNRAFVKGMTEQDPEYFEKLAHGQKPKYLWIGCSDSRVPADRITGTNPGEIFVHRNVANLVVHTDINMLSVVTYAVEYLEVEDIIVCGHYGCGGVQASLTANSFGLLDNWLRNIKDVYRLNERELDRLPPEKRVRRLVELNVIEQVYNLCKTSCIQEAWKKRPLKIHGWVYDVADGLLQDLQVNFSSAEDLDKVYRFEPSMREGA